MERGSEGQRGVSQVAKPESTGGRLKGSSRAEWWGLQCGWSADTAGRENTKMTLSAGAGTAGEVGGGMVQASS